MPTFLTVNEAAEKTGKSTSSIRRLLIYPVVKKDHHADRQYIEPNPDEVRALRLQGENFAWKINEEYLSREIAAKAAPANSKSGGKAREETSEPDSMVILREQLEHNQTQLRVKDQQIAALVEMMQSLNDRMREGNILMGSLQNQLSLGEGKANGQGNAGSVTDVEATPVKAEESKPRDAKAKDAKKPKKKLSLWGRVFG